MRELPTLAVVDLIVIYTRDEHWLGPGDTGQQAVAAVDELAAAGRETDAR